jgi:glycosyltransferase involved in cell wall biosynthesis
VRPASLERRYAALDVNAIHIATEGPLGILMRRLCLRQDLPFTTSFHTLFPEYVHARWSIPVDWTYPFLRRFHDAAVRTMVATPTIETQLRARGFRKLRRWSRGVDTMLFRPRAKNLYPYARPISLYVGRVAVEKGIDAFLALSLPGTKVVVGDGPARAELARRFPDVKFLGAKTGEDLAQHYASADVFVFPSRTDTFGLVLLEALACGVPVAAYPVAGPVDVIGDSGAGCLNNDLGRAVQDALAIPADVCRRQAERFSWEASTQQFLDNLVVIH